MPKRILVRIGLAAIYAGAFFLLWQLDRSRPRELRNPYREVDWRSVQRVKTQFHDHITNQQRLTAYDRAGYQAVSLFNYSGDPEHDSGWRERRWPPREWLSKEFRDSLQNIVLFFPNAEEVGFQHMTSPFLQRYVERWIPEPEAIRQTYHYASGQGLIDLIHRWGGMAFLAHPWEEPSRYADLEGYDAVEVYNAYARSKGRADRERRLVEFWDRRLEENPELLGVAVNDWFGPFFDELDRNHRPRPDATLLDSGKTIVLVSELTPAAFREAVRRGAMFAIKDLGKVKDRYPRIEAVVVDRDTIRLETRETVRWIANGVRVGVGKALAWRQLPMHARYVRAEVSNAEGSVVFTQPFALRAGHATALTTSSLVRGHALR